MVYPNPSSDQLNVYADEEITEIKIYSLSGALIQQLAGNSASLVSMDVSQLSGIYLVEVELNSGQLIQSKIITK